MTDSQLLVISTSMVAVLFGILMTIIGWLGSKLYAKLSELSRDIATQTYNIHLRINDHDRRLVRVETRIFDKDLIP